MQESIGLDRMANAVIDIVMQIVAYETFQEQTWKG